MKLNIVSTFRILLILIFIFSCNCFITSRTARITPINTNIHTISAEVILDEYLSDDVGANVKYSFRRGINTKYEIGFSAEVLHPALSFGGKYGFTEWFAIDLNTGMSVNVFDGMIFPIGDVALILGNTGLYGGLKYEVFTKGATSSEFWYDTDGTFHPFLGLEIKANDKINILPEICIGFLNIDYDRGIFPGSYWGFIGVGISF